MGDRTDTLVTGGDETQAGEGVRPGAGGSLDTVSTPGTAIGRYVVLGLVGHGGMGVVLAAYDPQLDRKVALKLVRPGRAADAGEIEREARVIARVRHPNLVTVHDVGHAEGGVFLAMEFVEGVSLREHQTRARRWRELVGIYQQAARGLAAVHDASIVHGDFKPDNVRVDVEADHHEVKLLDFGLAQVHAPDSAEVRGDRWAPPGTLVYMAPERLAGGAATPATDQFSFCVALYEALVGRRPFDLEVLGTARAATPTWSRTDGVPAWLRRALARGLEFDPAQRWPSMHALAQVLERGPGRAQRRAVAIALGAAAALVAVVAGTRPDVCADADAEVRGAWARPRGDARADDRADTSQDDLVAARIDAYAEALASSAVHGCNVTRGGPDALDARRRRCIAEGVATLRGWSTLLGDADPLRSHAVRADVLGSPREVRCEDDEALLHEPDPPPTADATDTELLDRLAQLRILRYWGARDRFDDDLATLIAGGRAADDRILLAEALTMKAWTQARRGESEQGYQQLLAALQLAESTGATRQQAEIWRSIAENRHIVEGGETLERLAIDRATAAAERAGSPPLLVAAIGNTRTGALLRAKDYEGAIAAADEAIAIAERIGAVRIIVTTLGTQVIAMLQADHIEAAVQAGARAVELADGPFAAGPESAIAMGAHAAALIAAGRFDEAADENRQALRRLERWGPLTLGSAAGVACNWCRGVDGTCAPQRVVEACTPCARLVLQHPSPSPALIAGLGRALRSLLPFDEAAARTFAEQVAAHPVEDAAWRTGIGAAASVIATYDPDRARELATRSCSIHGDTQCGENALATIAALEQEPRAAARSRGALRDIWARLDPSDRAESLPAGIMLTTHGLVPRAEVVQARALASSCEPSLADVDAWIAATAPAVPAHEPAPRAQHGTRSPAQNDD